MRAGARPSWAPILDTVLAEQALRDERDSTREHSPAAAGPGSGGARHERAVVEEVVERIARLAAAASCLGVSRFVSFG